APDRRSRMCSVEPIARGGIQTGARRVRVHRGAERRNRIPRCRWQARAAARARGRSRLTRGGGALLAGGAGALLAAKQATVRIPIVAVDLESDPVALGFVRNLAQPGGNITGVFLDLPELSGKQLQFLKEVIRPLSRVAIFGDPMLNAPQFQATEAAARAVAIRPQRLEVRRAQEIDTALEAASRGQANAVILLSSPLVFYHRAELGVLAVKRRLPAVSMFVEFAEAGGLMAYGPSLREAFRRAGGFTSRIL